MKAVVESEKNVAVASNRTEVMRGPTEMNNYPVLMYAMDSVTI